MQVRKLFASPAAGEQERKRAQREDRKEEKERGFIANGPRKEDEISNKAKLALEE